MMLSLLRTAWRQFRRDEEGAVTVDWVVLTAGVVSLALAVMVLLEPVIYEDAGGQIATKIAEAANY